MFFEEYGERRHPTIVMLHGANFVHCFGRQYVLSDRFHILVPHITGFGKEAGTVFTTEKAIENLTEIIRDQGKQVLLIGFSLGAQLAFRIVSETPELLTGAIIVSPWLIKEKSAMQSIMAKNEKQFHTLQNQHLCKMIGLMNGLPKEARKDFVSQMQEVSIESIRNSVDNGIELTAAHGFPKANLSILAIAGEKEPNAVKRSVQEMAAPIPIASVKFGKRLLTISRPFLPNSLTTGSLNLPLQSVKSIVLFSMSVSPQKRKKASYPLMRDLCLFLECYSSFAFIFPFLYPPRSKDT